MLQKLCKKQKFAWISSDFESESSKNICKESAISDKRSTKEYCKEPALRDFEWKHWVSVKKSFSCLQRLRRSGWSWGTKSQIPHWLQRKLAQKWMPCTILLMPKGESRARPKKIMEYIYQRPTLHYARKILSQDYKYMDWWYELDRRINRQVWSHCLAASNLYHRTMPCTNVSETNCWALFLLYSRDFTHLIQQQIILYSLN